MQSQQKPCLQDSVRWSTTFVWGNHIELSIFIAPCTTKLLVMISSAQLIHAMMFLSWCFQLASISFFPSFFQENNQPFFCSWKTNHFSCTIFAWNGNFNMEIIISNNCSSIFTVFSLSICCVYKTDMHWNIMDKLYIIVSPSTQTLPYEKRKLGNGR